MESIKLELKWGILFTLFSLLWMVFEKSMGWHGEQIENHAKYTLLFAIPAILFYVFALREKKNKDFNSKMSWGQGMVTGLKVTLVITILSPLAQYITHNFISPEYFENAILYAVENNIQSQEEAEAYFNFNSYLFQSAIGAFVMGILTSAIVALFLKSKSEKAAAE